MTQDQGMTILSEKAQGTPDPGMVILCRIAPDRIDLFTKLVEAYDNLAYVTALDGAVGKMQLSCAVSARRDVLSLLRRMPFRVSIEQVS